MVRLRLTTEISQLLHKVIDKVIDVPIVQVVQLPGWWSRSDDFVCFHTHRIAWFAVDTCIASVTEAVLRYFYGSLFLAVTVHDLDFVGDDFRNFFRIHCSWFDNGYIFLPVYEVMGSFTHFLRERELGS